jgi:hypothetical protein
MKNIGAIQGADNKSTPSSFSEMMVSKRRPLEETRSQRDEKQENIGHISEESDDEPLSNGMITSDILEIITNVSFLLSIEIPDELPPRNAETARDQTRTGIGQDQSDECEH